MKETTVVRVSLLALALCLTAAPTAASTTPDQKANITAEADRVAGTLDPVSAEVLRGNQKRWEGWAQALAKRAAVMVREGKASTQELEEVTASLKDQRRQFLSGIRPGDWQGMKGGWSDGMKEVLLDLNDKGYAKVASISHTFDGSKGICVIEGTAASAGDDIVVTPKDGPGHAVIIRRLGIALAIEDENVQPGTLAPYCQPGGALAGQYFRIEGADKVIPWLLY
ncbi:hypothetical protein [Novosphingobium sp. P6W]|uniref:hypothetical protein n=1 Tax=Novosphingobium sp. P6W TaxID=1609758 RepID=UPI0005C2E137|nr:hypothetical protein [Novosphingobium sp. P6W]KIS30025.1 hypothetical protein TQ38_25035 [Novosphingobium sp. P6W]